MQRNHDKAYWEDRKVRKLTVAIAMAAGAAATAAACSGQSQESTTVHSAQQAIAERFSACVVERAADTHHLTTPDNPNVPAGSDTVAVQIRLTQTGNAQKALAAYANSDAVHWDDPVFAVRSHHGSDEFGSIPPEQYEITPTTTDVSVMVYANPIDPNGTEKDIAVAENAFVGDYGKTNFNETATLRSCGALVKNAQGTWAMAKSYPNDTASITSTHYVSISDVVTTKGYDAFP